MLIIGITGGIGSGKSTVSNYLRKKGYYVIDADKISRELTANDDTVLYEIREAFGDAIFDKEGKLKRNSLAKIVFSDQTKKLILEKIVTKRVIEIIEIKLKNFLHQEDLNINDDRYKRAACFVDAPLLFEVGLNKLMNYSWVIDAADDVRINRVSLRDGEDKESILARIRNQMPREKKNAMADEIIKNDLDREELYHSVELLLRKYEI